MREKCVSQVSRHKRPTEQTIQAEIQAIVTKFRTSFTQLGINPPARIR